MDTKQLINELNSECILTKLEKKEITELLREGEANKKIVTSLKALWGDLKKGD